MRIRTELAWLLPSYKKVNKLKSSGLNLGAGRALSQLFLPDCMFTARLMKFGHGACFRSPPNLQWYRIIKAVELLLPPLLPVLLLPYLFWQRCLSLLGANVLRDRNIHSWPLPPPMIPSLHVKIWGSCLSTVALPIYHVACWAVVSSAVDHACVAWFTLLSSWAATRQQPAPGGTNGGFSSGAKPGAHLVLVSFRLPLCHT